MWREHVIVMRLRGTSSTSKQKVVWAENDLEDVSQEESDESLPNVNLKIPEEKTKGYASWSNKENDYIGKHDD